MVVTAGAIGLHRQARAGLHGDAVEQHRAGAALAGVAADLGARQARDIAKKCTSSRRGSTVRSYARSLIVMVMGSFMCPSPDYGRGILPSAFARA